MVSRNAINIFNMATLKTCFQFQFQGSGFVVTCQKSNVGLGNVETATLDAAAETLLAVVYCTRCTQTPMILLSSSNSHSDSGNFEVTAFTHHHIFHCDRADLQMLGD